MSDSIMDLVGASFSVGYSIGALLVSAFLIACQWIVFQKAGKPGWAALIPVYNTYVLFEILYNDGVKFLTLLIPFYNIYVMIKMYLDLARCFGQTTGFGIGLWLVSPVFYAILAFGGAQYIGPINKNYQ